MIFFRRAPDHDPDEDVTLAMRFHRWTSGWRGAVVLFILITPVMGLWKGRAAYGWIKEKRVDWLLAESEAARARGDFKVVKDKLRQAIVLLRRPRTLRAVARYQVEMHDLSALSTYAELLKTGQATLEDKVTFTREAFRLGRPYLAAAVFAEIKEHPETRETPTVLAMRAGQAAGEGRWPQALGLARRAAASPGNDQARAYAQSVLARLLLQPSSSDQAEGLSLLCSLARRPDAAGLEALEMLVVLAQTPQTASLFQNPQVEISPLQDAAARHPQAAPALKVGIWSLRLAAEPANGAKITQALFEQYQGEPSPVLRLEAARWLNKRKMHQRALDLAEPLKLESEEWFLLYLDATAALGDWDKVVRMLSNTDEKIPLSAGLRELFALRGAIETGSRPDLAAAWRELEITARTETAEHQLYMAGYAEQIGFRAEAARLYQRLLDRKDRADDILPAADKLNRPRRLACYTGLLRTGGGAMPLDDLREFMTAFAGEFPEIDEVQNDHAYLQLLAGRELEKAGSTARRLLQKKPELLAYRTTAALAALRRQEAAGETSGSGLPGHNAAPGPSSPTATAIYDGWGIDWSTAQDRYKAVYVAVLRAGGREPEAQQIAAQIKPAALRPEERKLAGLP